MAWNFYFAWLDDGNQPFDEDQHLLNEEQVVSFNVEHKEKECAGLTIVVRNPLVGFLNPARKVWAWISWRRPDDTVIPLFHGRLIAIPTELVGNLVSMEFVARPADYEAQKKALAESLKVVPYWDEIFVNEKSLDDPDVVLQARPQLYHIGRTDKLVTVSNILQGEAGTLVLGPSEVLDQDLSFQYAKALTKIKVSASVEWRQAASGIILFTDRLRQEFHEVGCKKGYAQSYTGQGLEKSWPHYGDEIGAGWWVDQSQPNLANLDYDRADFMVVPIDPKNQTPDIEVQDWWATSPEGYDYWYQKALEQWRAKTLLEPVREARFTLWDFKPRFDLRYVANRERKETLEFEVESDIQALLSDPGEGMEDVEEIQVNATNIGDPRDDGTIPMGDRKVAAYFSSDRGQDSIAYLLNLARSRLLMSARAVDVTVQIPFDLAVQLSCRHDVVLNLPELPGGTMGGKVTGYSLSLDQDTGNLHGSVTFAASIGNGNTLVPPDPGEESYVQEAYVDNEYQVFYGESLQPVAGELEYERPHYTPDGDDLDLNNLTPENVIGSLYATALLTFTSGGNPGGQVIIGGRTYTFVAALSTSPAVPNEVLLGGDEFASSFNLSAAIDRDEDMEGVLFAAGTVAHDDVQSDVSDGIIRVTARKGGVGGNSIAVSSTLAGATWDQPHLYDGHDGLLITGGPTEQENVMKTPPAPGSEKLAIERLNEHKTFVQLALVPMTGGPFETKLGLEVSTLMVPKTIDLAANPV